MIQLGQFNKAEELYDILLNQTTDNVEETFLFHQLGKVKNGQGKYEEAVGFYEKSIKINQNILPTTHSHLCASYSNIGRVYHNMGEYSKAHSYYERASDILKRLLPPNHLHLKIVKESIEIVKKKL